ncbi:hypothetical protein TNCV_2947131 [Trichonephila clavipes]|nr:hypothetical protein TNCV_2947131 [Trichonephila clavipes]
MNFDDPSNLRSNDQLIRKRINVKERPPAESILWQNDARINRLPIDDPRGMNEVFTPLRIPRALNERPLDLEVARAAREQVLRWTRIPICEESKLERLNRVNSAADESFDESPTSFEDIVVNGKAGRGVDHRKNRYSNV